MNMDMHLNRALESCSVESCSVERRFVENRSVENRSIENNQQGQAASAAGRAGRSVFEQVPESQRYDVSLLGSEVASQQEAVTLQPCDVPRLTVHSDRVHIDRVLSDRVDSGRVQNDREKSESEQNNRGQSAIVALYHSELAMAAAKKMRRSRQKQKTGQEVCHHLKMMLSSEPPRSAGRNRQEPQYSLGF